MDLFYGDQLQNQMPVMWQFLSYNNNISKRGVLMLQYTDVRLVKAENGTKKWKRNESF